MNDELDNMGDGELSEVFAVEVAGEGLEKLAFASRDGGESGALFESSRTEHGQFFHFSRADVVKFCDDYPEYKVCYRNLPFRSYAADANAVMPWLEKKRGWFAARHSDCENVHVTVYNQPNGLPPCGQFGMAKTFARAACVALIRAARAWKGAGK